jgi:hypothetical protein
MHITKGVTRIFSSCRCNGPCLRKLRCMNKLRSLVMVYTVV